MSRFVLVKTRVPDFYEGADCAVIEVTKDLILTLDKRIAQTKKMFDKDFYGTRWWDCTPYFVLSAGPESFGLDMSEEEFETRLDANESIALPEEYEPEEYDPIDTLILTISAVMTGKGTTMAGFQWSGYDKYVGDAGRVTTYELTEHELDEWAKLIGYTDIP